MCQPCFKGLEAGQETGLTPPPVMSMDGHTVFSLSGFYILIQTKFSLVRK